MTKGKAYDGWKQSLTLEALITKISSRFINLPAERIESGIRRALAEIGRFAGVDRAFFYLKARGDKTARTYAWARRGIKPWVHNWRNLCVESFPWWKDKLSRFEPILISRLTDLSSREPAKKEFLRAHRIRSFIAVPVEKSRVVSGFLGMDSGRKEMDWPAELIPQLKLVGEIFLNALERQQAEEIIRRRNTQLELIQHIQKEIPLEESLEKVLQTTADSIGHAFGFYKISINLFDPKTQEIVYLLGWNKTGLPLPRGHRQKLGEGLIGKAALRRQTIVANDVSIEPDFIRFHLSQTKAELVIPLLVQERLVGVLDIQDNKTGVFNSEDVAVLQSLARYIAHVLDSRQKELALRESLEKYRTIIENIQEGYYEVDLAGNFTFANDSLCRMLGYPMERVLGMNNREYMDEPSARQIYSVFNRVFKTGEPVNLVELDVITADGNKHHAEFSVSLMRGPDNQPVGFRGIIRDVTQRKLAEERIKASLREKEVLLREIHHRVKNNLQVISSLLNLQSRSLSDPAILKVFKECQNRVRSMALVHEKLYRSGDLSRIDFSEYIRSLVYHLCHVHQIDSSRIHLREEVEAIQLDINTAIPCGLILNELVSNSLKHAFPDGREGEIYVQFKRQGENRLLLSVRDDGIGLAEDLDINKTSTLGLQIITLLVQQLDATLEIHRQPGTEFRILFSELKYPTPV